MQSWLQGGMLVKVPLADQPSDGYVFSLDLSDAGHTDADGDLAPGRLPVAFSIPPGATASRAAVEALRQLTQRLAKREEDAFMGVNKPKPTLHVPKKRGFLSRAWDRLRGVER